MGFGANIKGMLCKEMPTNKNMQGKQREAFDGNTWAQCEKREHM